MHPACPKDIGESINLAFYYEYFDFVDSASVTMQELYNTTSRIESKYDASQWLTRYYASIKDYEKATEFAIKFIDANLAVNNKRNLEHTTNAMAISLKRLKRHPKANTT